MGSPIRAPARYRELAQAILDAPASTQETDFLEWKSEVALAEKRWQAQFGRHTLGFANREPEVAARWFGGCAYLVAGVSPGRLDGTQLHDTAKIEAWLAAYVGPASDAPEWAPTYVELHGKQILIITIEAPEPGDRMWACHREFVEPTKRGRDKIITRKGAIYVRRKASTEEAGPADIEMLSRRLKATGKRVSGLSVVLLPGSLARGMEFGDEIIDRWIAGEREALQPPAQQRVAETDEEATRQQIAAGGLTPAALRRLVALQDIQLSAAKAFFEGDGRTREQYLAEVETYLTKARKQLPRVVLSRCYERHLGRVRLAVRNDTEDPMQDVRLQVTISAKSARAFDDDDIPEGKMPNRPVMLGKLVRNRFDVMAPLSVSPYLGDIGRFQTPTPYSPRRIKIENTGSAHITFDPGDLYPKETAPLEEFLLLANYAIDPDALETMTAEWTAVTRNLSGVQSGSLEIPVAPEMLSIEELLAEFPDDEARDEDDE